MNEDEVETPVTPTPAKVISNQPSPYELERMKNIERNRALLAGLGITNKLIAHHTPQEDNTPAKRTYKKRQKTIVPTREYSLRNSPVAQKMLKKQKKEEKGSNLFDGLRFALVGRIKKPKVPMSQFKLMELIRRHGGSPRTGAQVLLSQQITHLVTTEDKVDELGQELIKQLKEKEIAIINENFIFDSIKRKKLQNELKYAVLKEDKEEFERQEEAAKLRKKRKSAPKRDLISDDEDTVSLERSKRNRRAPVVYGFENVTQNGDNLEDETTTNGRPRRNKKQTLYSDFITGDYQSPEQSRVTTRQSIRNSIANQSPALTTPKTKREQRYDSIEALLETQEQKYMYSIWRRLATLREDDRYVSELFMDLPSKKLYPQYYILITEPICMKQIEGKIIDGLYVSIDDFRKDLEKMVQNAQTFNQEGSIVYEDSVKIMDTFNKATKQDEHEKETLQKDEKEIEPSPKRMKMIQFLDT